MATPAGARIRLVELLRPSDPYGIAAGSDGALWFTNWRANAIGRITPGGEIAEFPITAPARELHATAAGPDDATSFAAESGAIGRVEVRLRDAAAHVRNRRSAQVSDEKRSAVPARARLPTVR